MLSYFFVNLSLNGIVLIYLHLLNTSPYRIRFRLIMVALINWLIPYKVVIDFLNPPKYISISYIEEISRNLNTGNFSISANNHWLSPNSIMFGLMFIGIILLVTDFIKLHKKIKSTQANSIFIKNEDTDGLYEIKSSNDVFVAGIFHPRIYIGDELYNSKYAKIILAHEIQHINNHDPLWLVLIALIQRLFWWNPVVGFMAAKARKYIELSCDSSCKNKFDTDMYQQELAEILLLKHEENKVFNPSIFSNKNFNIFRVKQLSREFKMNKKNKYLLITTLMIPLFLLSLSVSISTASSDNTGNKNSNHILANDEVDITLGVKLQKNSPKQNNEVKTQSIKSRLISKFGKQVSLNASGIDMEISIKPHKINGDGIYLETVISFLNKTEKIKLTPSIITKNNTEAQIVINDESYKLELNLLPVFKDS